MVEKPKKYENRTAVSILSYLVIGLIWYLVDEKAHKDKIVKHHVSQGIVLLIASLLYSIVLSIVLAIFSITIFLIPFLGLLLYSIFSLLYFVPLICVIIGIINASKENTKELPMIGKYGRKIKL